ncbi:CD209 antigen-like protein B [Cololabis saira]|uniref:CD209 antigen-like protein B n=1 Tax=Cololabis saira TaxID=129043 RepID=UPI002AD40179|nr:CD209 antigen-like protein B [Cololabis saira]
MDRRSAEQPPATEVQQVAETAVVMDGSAETPVENSSQEDVIDPQSINVSERCDESASGNQDQREETPGVINIPRYRWQLCSILIFILSSIAIGFLVVEIKNQHSNNNKLKQLLNSSYQNVSILENEILQLKVLLNEFQMENKELKVHLNSTLDKYNLIQAQLEETNTKQHSILSSNRLSFLWNFCNKDTLQCLSCMPGWVEHASRCFLLSDIKKNWEDARRDCLDKSGDLAVVLDAEDQALLTNMTFQYKNMHPEENFHSAWIGLQDMGKENTFLWVNGNGVMADVNYWNENEPNNAIPFWDSDRAGQDCVAIVPPKNIEKEGWLNSWDDIICGGRRHYICETTALILPRP